MTDEKTRPGPITSLPMIGVPVSDTDVALRFYRDVLGFVVVNDTYLEQLDGRLVVLEVAAGENTVIALFPHATSEETGVGTGIRFRVEDARAWYRYLQDAGATVHELLEWPGVPPMFIFEDPDKNALVIVS